MATIYKLAKAQKISGDDKEASTDKKSGKFKQRVLALSSRGINNRFVYKVQSYLISSFINIQILLISVKDTS